VTTTIQDHDRNLLDHGYTLVHDVFTDDDAATVLRAFGEPIAQYDGSLRYEVKAVAGFENRRYSKSVNTIHAHTEAPGWDPPPRYLALHCHVQARCGSGHTLVADLAAFFATLDEETRAMLSGRHIDWLGHNMSGVGTGGVRRPIITPGPDRDIIRFSHNLLTTGEYDPALGSTPEVTALPLGDSGVQLAGRMRTFCRDHGISILIPENTILVWDNQRLAHARSEYRDARRHLSRYWLSAAG
jgi:alpha-ketoglutarate-dependent taurine dioxygenase